ncbi:carcinoembryonic antigen-related cell adhesion molecule 19-like [Eublepharis macularius]|uniref:Carcinoembryonic antigen-related cell adhesion molecule 19-like n=1 Tax=Eublepharis macularius TaxID=481883 RepID=A0AA97KF63_EUBMA|nr:carcinoembryonic antigen-related cell adhesion molecule 19-like [Eublepharis macularius]
MKRFRNRNIFYTGFLLSVFLLCFPLPPTQATESLPIVTIPENPAQGQDVTLSVENVTGSIRQFDWYRGLVTDGGSRIFTYFTGENKRPQRNGVRSTNREFGYPNGSLLIKGVQQNDSGPYSVIVLIRPKGTYKGTTVLQLAASATDAPPTTPPVTTLPAKVPSTLGWIVAGVLVGILLAGALGAILVYRFVLQKAEPGTGVAMKLDPRGKKNPASRRDDKEPIYEVMDLPMESPQMAGKPPPPIPSPLPPLAGTCPVLDSNYMCDAAYEIPRNYMNLSYHSSA